MSKIASAVASFFKDPDASSVITMAAQQIAAPVVRGQDIAADELMQSGGALRVVMMILDGSGSMSPVAKMLVEDFNNEFVPAVQEARGDDISTLRIGGLAFDHRIAQIWGKPDGQNTIWFHRLEDLPPLTEAEYIDAHGGGTALHQVIIEGTTIAMRYAAEIQSTMGIAPDVDIISLSDSDNNCPPRDPKAVRSVIQGRDRSRVRYAYFFFDTGSGAEHAEQLALDMGFDSEEIQVFAAKPGETDDERRSRFRRMFRVMSRVSASKGMSAAKAGAAAAAAGDADDVI